MIDLVSIQSRLKDHIEHHSKFPELRCIVYHATEVKDMLDDIALLIEEVERLRKEKTCTNK